MRETSVRATPGRNGQGQDVHDSSLYYSLLSSETKNGQREGLGSRTRIQAGTQKKATQKSKCATLLSKYSIANPQSLQCCCLSSAWWMNKLKSQTRKSCLHFSSTTPHSCIIETDKHSLVYARNNDSIWSANTAFRGCWLLECTQIEYRILFLMLTLTRFA